MRLLSFPKKPQDQVDLQTERLWLRRPDTDHFEEWASLRGESAAHLRPFEPLWNRDELSRAAYRARLRQQDADITSGRGCHWFLFAQKDGALLGGVSLTNIRRGIIEGGTFGYWMGERHSGQHFMREAVTAIADHAFQRMFLHRLEAATVPENVASQKLLRACGFSEEGYARGYLKINGQWRDHVLFALLNPSHKIADDTPISPPNERL